jgi:hypothetical protein
MAKMVSLSLSNPANYLTTKKKNEQQVFQDFLRIDCGVTFKQQQ